MRERGEKIKKIKEEDNLLVHGYDIGLLSRSMKEVIKVLIFIVLRDRHPHAPSRHQMTMKTEFNLINLRETIMVYPFIFSFF